MHRRSTTIGLAVLALAAGCGGESTPGAGCRDAYVKLYSASVKLLQEASPSDPDIDNRMRNVLGTRPPKQCSNPRTANDTLDEVAREFGPQFAALEGKWGRDNLSGFRDPLGAGHGEPIDRGSSAN